MRGLAPAQTRSISFLPRAVKRSIASRTQRPAAAALTGTARTPPRGPHGPRPRARRPGGEEERKIRLIATSRKTGIAVLGRRARSEKRAEARSPTTVTEKNEVMPAEQGQGHSDLAVDAVDREQQCVELRAHLLGRHLLRAQLEGSGSLSRSAAQPLSRAREPRRLRGRARGAGRGVAWRGMPWAAFWARGSARGWYCRAPLTRRAARARA